MEIGHNLRNYLFGRRFDTRVFEEEVSLHGRRTLAITQDAHYSSLSPFLSSSSSRSSSSSSLSSTTDHHTTNSSMLATVAGGRTASRGDDGVSTVAHPSPPPAGFVDSSNSNRDTATATAIATAANYNPSLLVHHLLFFLVEFHTFRSRTNAYYCNIFKIWEATAPVSFLVWVAQRRWKWRREQAAAAAAAAIVVQDEDRALDRLDTDDDGIHQGDTSCQVVAVSDDATGTTTTTNTTAAVASHSGGARPLLRLPFRLGSETSVLWLSVVRIGVWLVCRTLFDVYCIRSMHRAGIFPWGHQAGRLNLGNKIQLWLAAPIFWFGLNPLWLHGMLRSLWKLVQERRLRRANQRALVVAAAAPCDLSAAPNMDMNPVMDERRSQQKLEQPMEHASGRSTPSVASTLASQDERYYSAASSSRHSSSSSSSSSSGSSSSRSSSCSTDSSSSCSSSSSSSSSRRGCSSSSHDALTSLPVRSYGDTTNITSNTDAATATATATVADTAALHQEGPWWMLWWRTNPQQLPLQRR